jgi:hypothetical protein
VAQLVGWLGRPLPDGYPNHLAAPQASQAALRPAWGVLGGLLLLSLIPRLVMAWKLDVICVDGAYYIRLAEAWERGDLATALTMQLNIYPIVLMLLHELGLPWDIAGRAWGVLMATLVVLPLFGWIRRQFDDRVAIVACILYAVHPETIEWSPELVRDPTFWLFFTTALYFSWRAIVELRWDFFFCAGLAIALSAITRFEGLFLIIPLAGWTLVRWFALEQGRQKLLIGAGGAVLALPTLLLLAQSLWLHQVSQRDIIRVDPLERVERWVASWSHEAAATTSAAASGAGQLPAGGAPPIAVPLPTADTPWKFRHLAWAYLHTMERGLTPFFGMLLFGGYFAWRRVFDRRDHLPMTLLALAIGAAIWIHLWYAHLSSSRYSIAIVIMSSRAAALGLLGFGHWVSRVFERLLPVLALRRWATPALLASLMFIGWYDALSSEFRSRFNSRQLGQWIQTNYGNARMIVGTNEQLRLVSYYAQANFRPIPPELRGESLVQLVEQQQPDLVILAPRATEADYDALLAQQQQLGLKRVDPAELPDSNQMTVLSRVLRR